MKKIFIITMAFVAMISIWLGTGWITNKVNSTNDTHSEGMMMPSTKTSPPTTMTLTIGTITDTTVELTNTWIEGTSETTIGTKYLITNSQTGKNVDTVYGNHKDGVDVIKFSGLTENTNYIIKANLIFSGSTYDLEKVVEFKTTLKPMTVTSLRPISTTNTTIQVRSIWTNGTDSLVQVAKIEYSVLLAGVFLPAFKTTSTSIANTTSMDTVMIGDDLNPLTENTEYKIVAQFFNSSNTLIESETVKTNTTLAPMKVVSLTSPTKTDTTIDIEAKWINGTDESIEVNRIDYTVAQGGIENPLLAKSTTSIANTTSIDTITIGDQLNPLLENSEYKITAHFFNNLGTLIGTKDLVTKTAIAPMKVISLTTPNKTDTTIDIEAKWINGTDALVEVSQIKYTVALSGIDQPLLATTTSLITNTTSTDAITIGDELNPLIGNSEYKIEAQFYNKADGLIGKEVLTVWTLGPNPTDIVMTTNINQEETITVKTTWIEGSDKVMATVYDLALSTNPTEIINTKLGTPRLGTDAITFKGLEADQEYNINLTLTTTKGIRYETKQDNIITSKIAPIITINPVTNHSLGKIQFTIDYDAKNAVIDWTRSEATITETIDKNLIMTMPLNPNPYHIYEVDGLKDLTSYNIDAKITTDWNELQLPIWATTKQHTTLASTALNAKTVISQKTPANFGKADGEALVTTTVTPATKSTLLTAPTISLDGGLTTALMLNHQTEDNVYTYEIDGLKANNLLGNNIIDIQVVIKDDQTTTLTQNEQTLKATLNEEATKIIPGTISVKEGRTPIITSTIDTSKVIKHPQDGTVTYKPGSLTTTLVNHQDGFQIKKANIDVSEAMFKVVDTPETLTTSLTNTKLSETTNEYGTVTLTLQLVDDLVITKEQVASGYTLGIDGIKTRDERINKLPFNSLFNFEPIGPAPIAPIASETNAIEIALIIMTPLVLFMLIGSGICLAVEYKIRK